MRNFLFRKSDPEQPRETREMVLLSLARAEENARSLAATDLVRELELTRAAVDANLHALVEQGLVRTTPSGGPELTDSGRARALSLLRRHRLTERLFTDVMGLDWARAHVEADKLEHSISAEAEAQIAARLGDPDTCPHGNPIPNSLRTLSEAKALPLAECPPLTHASIARIALETPASLQHLATLGLLPQVEIQVENKAPFDGPVMVRVGRAHYALGRDLAARIWVNIKNS